MNSELDNSQQVPKEETHAALEFDQGLRDYKEKVDGLVERLDLKAGSANVYDIPFLDGEPSGPPVVLAQGFAVLNIPRIRNMYEISKCKRRLLSLHPAGRYGGNTEKIEGQYTEDARRAQQIIEILKRKGVDRADLIGKSGGAAGSLIAAILRPDLIQNVVLFNPSGMGKETTLGISKKFIRKMQKQRSLIPADPKVDPTMRQARNELLMTILPNPKRTIQEIQAFAGADVNSLMRSAAESGVMISVMASVDDQYFPVDKTLERLGELKAQGTDPSPFIGFYSVRGMHDDVFGDDPMRIRLCMNALENMQSLRQKKNFWNNMSA